MPVTILTGDCMDKLREIPDASVQCVVSSPPYWGLRSYIADGDPLKPLEIGLEASPAEFVARMVKVFDEVRRVLKPDGILFLNLGDCYATGADSELFADVRIVGDDAHCTATPPLSGRTGTGSQDSPEHVILNIGEEFCDGR